jgi:hypothetical protein
MLKHAACISVNNKFTAYILPCRSLLQEGRLSYKASGVDISAADALVNTIKRTATLTNRTGMLGSIGGFGGIFDTKAAGYRDPLLVSGTDGVGTKLKVGVDLCSSNFRVRELARQAEQCFVSMRMLGFLTAESWIRFQLTSWEIYSS